MKHIRLIVYTVYFFLFTFSHCQDLQFECITCADKFDKCELDCAWSLQSLEMKQIVKCQSDCAEQVKSCVDSPSALKCLDCTVTCSANYDNSMRRCLADVERKKLMTYSLSDCEADAFTTMDACMLTCSPQK